jgi:PhnB protein
MSTESAGKVTSVRPVPAGYQTVSPYLIVKDAAAALHFYKEAFGASETRRLKTPDGKIMHAEMKIGDSMVFLASEFPDHGAFSPEHFGGSPASIVLYVDNADALFSKAIAGGATSLRPMQDQFFGERSGTVLDPFGHRWTLNTHIEDVSEEEMERRFAAMMKATPSPEAQ